MGSSVLGRWAEGYRAGGAGYGEGHSAGCIALGGNGEVAMGRGRAGVSTTWPARVLRLAMEPSFPAPSSKSIPLPVLYIMLCGQCSIFYSKESFERYMISFLATCHITALPHTSYNVQKAKQKKNSAIWPLRWEHAVLTEL